MTDPTTRPRSALRIGSLALLICALPACSSSARTIRITSEPIGASVVAFRLGIHGTTPYEFFGLKPTDRILIGKAGYKDWTGRVENLPKAGRGTSKVQLQSVR